MTGTGALSKMFRRALVCGVAGALVFTSAACGGDDSDGDAAARSDGDVTTYTIPSLLDFSGAFANRGEPVQGMQQLLFDWFNDNAGKDVGVRLELKPYDTSYDVAKSLASYEQAVTDEPIAMLEFGTPNVAATIAKLPGDKIPAVIGGPTNESIVAGTWLQAALGQYGHYFASAVKWKLEGMGSGPVRVSFVSFDGISAQGWKKFFEQGLEGVDAEIVSEEYIAPTATDVTVNVNRVIESNPDLVILATTDQIQPLVINALAQNGFDMSKVVNSQHESMGLLEQLGVEPAALEGQFEVNTQRYQDESTEAYKIYEEYQGEVETRWAADTLLHFPSTMIVLQAIERAARKVGADKITGTDVHNEMTNGTFDMYGLMGDVTFKDGLGGPPEAYILQYKGGKVEQVASVPLAQ